MQSNISYAQKLHLLERVISLRDQAKINADKSYRLAIEVERLGRRYQWYRTIGRLLILASILAIMVLVVFRPISAWLVCGHIALIISIEAYFSGRYYRKIKQHAKLNEQLLAEAEEFLQVYIQLEQTNIRLYEPHKFTYEMN